jgi:hypothetical protein
LLTRFALTDKPIQQNDVCSDAITIAAGGTMSGTTTAATFDNVGTCGSISNTAPGVWYTIVGDGSAFFIASMCNRFTDFDTKISVFTGGCDDLVCVGGNDDIGRFRGCSSDTSELEFQNTEGTVYSILVHGFESETGSFDLTLTSIPPLVVSTRIES